MASSPSPLALLAALRDHLIKGLSVDLQGEDAVFVGVDGQPVARHGKHAPTAYVSKSTKKPYDLLAVWLCYKFAHLAFVDYVAQCRSEKAGIISTVDKRELIAYLKGDIEVSAQILGDDGEPTDKGASGSTGGASEKRTAAASGSENGDVTKKRKLEGSTSKDANKENKAKATTNATGANPAATAEDKEADTELKKVLDKEYTHRNRTTVLNAAKKSFDHVLKAVEAANAETKEKIEKASKAALVMPAATRKEQLPLATLMQNKIHGNVMSGTREMDEEWVLMLVYRLTGTPIIVVPAGFSDLLTMLNIKDFLVDGVYVSNMQKKSEGHRKAQSITITHEEDGEKYTFNIVDNVTRFKEKDWYGKRHHDGTRGGRLLICPWISFDQAMRGCCDRLGTSVAVQGLEVEVSSRGFQEGYVLARLLAPCRCPPHPNGLPFCHSLRLPRLHARLHPERRDQAVGRKDSDDSSRQASSRQGGIQRVLAKPLRISQDEATVMYFHTQEAMMMSQCIDWNPKLFIDD
jgi:hypothetical protein